MTRLLLALPGVLLACASVPRPSGSSSPLFERITLEQSGDAVVHTYRIPALTVL
jgi:hypothetical protein